MTRHAPLLLLLLLPALFLGCRAPAADGDADRMAREHQGDTPLPTGAAAPAPGAEVETSTVTYAQLASGPVSGFLARPAAGSAGAPGIIVIHEWWGLNDNVRSMARQLAGQGYAALAVDLYGGRAATDAAEARALMSAAGEHEAVLEDNLRQAYRYLAEQQHAPRVGTIGWCFGGGWSLRAALLLPGEIDATVIYYGHLVTDREQLAKLDMPMLGIFGALDEGIPVASVREFESVLKALGKNVEIHVYDGADHAFANPSGTRYQAQAAEDAWARTLRFFDAHLRPR